MQIKMEQKYKMAIQNNTINKKDLEKGSYKNEAI